MEQSQPGSGDRGCQCLDHKPWLCLESASACSSLVWSSASPLAPSPEALPCSPQRDPFPPVAVGTAPACPAHHQHLCSPALQHSRALHPLELQEKDVSSKIPMVDGDMRKALCSQPLAQEHHGAIGKNRELGRVGVERGWIWAGGSKNHCTNVLVSSCCSLFITAATLSKSKSKGELWLHPYLWQSHVLSPTPPWQGWHRCPAGRTLPDTLCSPWVPLQPLSTGQSSRAGV